MGRYSSVKMSLEFKWCVANVHHVSVTELRRRWIRLTMKYTTLSKLHFIWHSSEANVLFQNFLRSYCTSDIFANYIWLNENKRRYWYHCRVLRRQFANITISNTGKSPLQRLRERIPFLPSTVGMGQNKQDLQCLCSEDVTVLHLATGIFQETRVPLSCNSFTLCKLRYCSLYVHHLKKDNFIFIPEVF